MRNRWLLAVTFALFTDCDSRGGCGWTRLLRAANDVFATVRPVRSDSRRHPGRSPARTSRRTLEAGEVPPAGNTASIWYKWTAPADDIVSFDTSGSIDPTVPEPLPTEVRAYTGADGGFAGRGSRVLPAR